MDINLSQPQVTAALIAGGVALIVSCLTFIATMFATGWKLRADHKLALSEKAWADYELRRDIYMDVARQIDCLFASGNADDRPEFHRLVRKVRLVGSDQVVRSLNALTASIREGKRSDVLEQRYGAFFNAMRRDIRHLRELPPEGTDLGADAFPIEG